MHTHIQSVTRKGKVGRVGLGFGWVASECVRAKERNQKKRGEFATGCCSYLRLGCSTVFSDPVVRFESRAV